MNILIAASEAGPFVKSGGLGDVIGSLPEAISTSKIEVRAVVPLHGNIPQEYKDKMEFLTSIEVPVSWRKQYCGIFTMKKGNVTWYFIDNEYYFNRGDALYGCFDDAERYAFFSQAVLEMIPHIDFEVDIIHCNDWQTALIPIYLKLYRTEEYCDLKTVFTIHNIEYQGKFDRCVTEDVLGINMCEFDNGFLEHDGCVNLMKAAIISADRVTTVSESYAVEIQTPEYGHCLESIIRENSYKLSGIVNGIDSKAFSPKYDMKLFEQYSSENVAGKKVNKEQLQRLLNLHQDPDIPIVAFVGRLVYHKGIDILAQSLEQLLEKDIQIVILGTGDWHYEEFLREKASQYPTQMSINTVFNPDLASKIYGAADFVLMPSKSEPCGLVQMIALSYGAIPIVRETGGLKDTILHYDVFTGEGNGFTFEEFSSYALTNAIFEACEFYRDKEMWEVFVKQVMEIDYSWKVSARKYRKLFKEMTLQKEFVND